jgi:hypothetical protein
MQMDESMDDSADNGDASSPNKTSSKKRKRIDDAAQINVSSQKLAVPGTKRSRQFLHELQDTEIYLPSSYPDDVRQHPAMTEATAIEDAIRRSDANEALDKLRAHLAVTYGLYRHLKKAATQHLKQRSHAPAARLKAAVHSTANVYRRARVALVFLGMAENDETYHPLKNSHLRAFVVNETDRRWGDSKNTKQPWVWGNLSFVGKDMSDGMKNQIMESKYLLVL